LLASGLLLVADSVEAAAAHVGWLGSAVPEISVFTALALFTKGTSIHVWPSVPTHSDWSRVVDSFRVPGE
jgi:hypothetical protein